MITFPHCDAAVLHSPSQNCKYCNDSGLQEVRRAWNIAFTGEEPVGDQTQCPAERARPVEVIERWGGNVPTSGPTFGMDRVVKALKNIWKDTK